MPSGFRPSDLDFACGERDKEECTSARHAFQGSLPAASNLAGSGVRTASTLGQFPRGGRAGAGASGERPGSNLPGATRLNFDWGGERKEGGEKEAGGRAPPQAPSSRPKGQGFLFGFAQREAAGT